LAGADTLRTLTQPDRRDRVNRWVGVSAGVVSCVAMVFLTVAAIIRRAERVSEQVLVSPPPVMPMLVQAPQPIETVPGARFARTFDVSSFRRGNIHTHSNRSDGDSEPNDVYTWYRDHGYDFVAITDHNTFTNPSEFRSLETPGFLVIGGEELTMRGAGRQVHVNGLCTNRKLPGGTFAKAGDALAHGVHTILETGGIALINHPNFNWGIRADDLPAASGARLFEIQSGHPQVRPLGNGPSHPSCEALWDMGLTAGLDFMGVAVDDAHHFHDPTKQVSGPGRAWVDVFATSLDAPSICSALESGLLYSSTGPSLARISVVDDTYSIWSSSADVRVQFVGTGGKVLADRKPAPKDGSVSYKIAGSEGYVRARVLTPDGKAAWTPAVRVLASPGQAHANESPRPSASPI
jgi:hypothetical protein